MLIYNGNSEDSGFFFNLPINDEAAKWAGTPNPLSSAPDHKYEAYPDAILSALGYSSYGGNASVGYAYTLEATGTYSDLVDAGKVVMKNITDLVLP